MDFSYLKKGDTVVIQYRSSGYSGMEYLYLFATVLDVGVKKIKTDKGDFSTQRGHQWGKDYYHAGYYLDNMPVEEARKENTRISAEHERMKLARELEGVRFRNYNVETLKAIKALIDDPKSLDRAGKQV
jgi:hypothetical protein